MKSVMTRLPPAQGKSRDYTISESDFWHDIFGCRKSSEPCACFSKPSEMEIANLSLSLAGLLLDQSGKTLNIGVPFYP